jgi:hypothetical protein
MRLLARNLLREFLSKFGRAWYEQKDKMLNLQRDEDQLTQGQPPAERVLANPGLGSSPEAQSGAVQTSAQAGSAADQTINPQVIARRVYELMKQDLVINHERRGLRRK